MPFCSHSENKILDMPNRGRDIVQIAIEVCTSREFKSALLMSDIDVDKCTHDRKQDFDQNVENITAILLEVYGMESQQLERVIGTVFAIAMRLLAWAVHFEGTFDIPRDVSINILNRSLFTEEGILDEEKVALELLSRGSLTLQQKYQLTCLYCFKDRIPALFQQIKDTDLYKEIIKEKNPKLVNHSGLVVFWTYFAMGEIDILREKKTVAQCRFDMAVESGSKLALDYCLQKSSIGKIKNSLISAVVDILVIETRKRTKSKESNYIYFDDWIVFRGQKYNRSQQLWVPSHCLIDMLYFLISKLTREQLKEAFSKFFLSIKYSESLQESQGFTPLKGLEFLFRWPYQDRFMELIKSLWDVLPEKAYSYFLLYVCDRIDPTPLSLLYGEEKYFDYRKLLMELWQVSPDHFKRYVFCGKEIISAGRKMLLKDGKEILTKLFRLSNFNDEDRRNINIILSNLTCSEKIFFITSDEANEICKDLIQTENTELFEELASNCFDSEKEALQFIKSFTFFKAKDPCLDFVSRGELEAAELFLNRYDLSEDEVRQLKEKILFSGRGKLIFLQFYFNEPEMYDRFMKWGLSSEDIMKTFKEELILSKEGMLECQRLVENVSLESLNQFANWCMPDKDHSHFKKAFAEKAGLSICEYLILGSRIRNLEEMRTSCDFRGGRWQEADDFLKWCYTCEEDIRNFKKKLLSDYGKEIHFKLIRCNQWREAENFFAWLALSQEEVKELKKQTLFNCGIAGEMFDDLVQSDEGDANFTMFGWKHEAIEKFLKWYLEDMDAVIEFKNRYRRYEEKKVVKYIISQLHKKYKTEARKIKNQNVKTKNNC